MVYLFLSPASFAEHNVWNNVFACNSGLFFLLLNCMPLYEYTQFIYPFSCWWASGLFPVWGQTAMNITIDWHLYPPQNSMLKPSAQCDGIQRWGLWEITRSWGLSHEWCQCHYRQTPERCLVPPPCQGHSKKKAIYEPGSSSQQTPNLLAKSRLTLPLTLFHLGPRRTGWYSPTLERGVFSVFWFRC